MMSANLQRVLFFCDGRADLACMAEGLLKARDGGRFDVYSAGLAPAPTSALAIHAMNEIGIDITAHPARALSEFEGVAFDHVIIVCPQADTSGLDFARDGEVVHWSLPCPGDAAGTDEQKLMAYREARDALGVRVEAWMEGQ